MSGGVYMDRIFKALANGVINAGAAKHIQVSHDEWCKIYSNEACNCDPDLMIEAEGGAKCWITKDGILTTTKP